ncbi:hypothetical protein ACFQJC_10300 [Haloferax namakaokahaiae]|uniref:Uncharacterized protein n=1 Tax=Haloferax namakaokahaiae TaxID=1748331 RepID=A0ABD5ZFB8_9EURY
MDERGQAYALEGFMAAILLFTALLFSMQAVILTPTTAGTVDQDVKTQIRAEAHDNLVIANGQGELEHLALYWNNSTGTFAHAYNNLVGYNTKPPCGRAPDAATPKCEDFGERLNATFTSRGFVYNLYLDYRSATNIQQTESTTVVYRGTPSSNAVTATFRVVLYDEMVLRSPEDADGRPLSQLGPDEFYASDIDPGPVYNIVEVRIVVW